VSLEGQRFFRKHDLYFVVGKEGGNL
jgi:hypothetical protein